MRHFLISELERLSGIKAHTIRAWEIRYAVFSPERNQINVRHYTIDDLKYLLNISLLIKNGYKISQLARTGNKLLEQKVLSFQSGKYFDIATIDRLLILMFLEDVKGFEAVLDEYIGRVGHDKALREIILPFLKRSNILSYSRNDTEVHFAVTALRKKIIVAIDSLTQVKDGSNTALLFLFKDEHYDLILLYINYLLKANGVEVFYLGTNISQANLEKVVAAKRPGTICSYVATQEFNRKTYAMTIEKVVTDNKLYIFHPFAKLEMGLESINLIINNLGGLNLIEGL